MPNSVWHFGREEHTIEIVHEHFGQEERTIEIVSEHFGQEERSSLQFNAAK
jgi:hypothetical protein